MLAYKILTRVGTMTNQLEQCIILNTVNQLKLLYPYCDKNRDITILKSRDRTVLIFLLWFTNYCALLQLVSVLFSICYSSCKLYISLLTFLRIIILTGKPMHMLHQKCCTPPLSSIKQSIHCSSLSATFYQLRFVAIWIKNCSKSVSVVKVATIKYADDSHYAKQLSRTTTKLTFFAVSPDEWNTKEDTGNSSIACTAVCQRHLLGLTRCQTVNPVALAIIELCLYDSINQ